MSRYAVFIDGGYLSKVLKGLGEPKICFRKLSEILAGPDERLRTYYYHCDPYQSVPPSPEEQERKSKFDRFIAALEKSVPRMQVRLGRLARRQRPDGAWDFEQKKVDVLLTVDLVRLSCERQIQRAVLIAGDSDFVPAIQVAKDSGTIVQLYYSGNPPPHDELLRACDDRFIIDQEFIDSIRL